MTITFVAGGVAAADTLTLPSLTIGDTLIGIGLAPAAGSVLITIPGTWWTQKITGTSSGRSHAFGVHFIADSSFTFGTWTTATKVAYLIFRSDSGIVVPLQMTGIPTNTTNATVVHPSVSSAIFSTIPNDPRVLLLASSSVVGNGAADAVTDFTQILHSTLESHDLVVDLSDAEKSSHMGTTRTLSASAISFGTSWLLWEVPYSLPSGGGVATHNPFGSRAFGGSRA
jgi:hypothetical protein